MVAPEATFTVIVPCCVVKVKVLPFIWVSVPLARWPCVVAVDGGAARYVELGGGVVVGAELREGGAVLGLGGRVDVVPDWQAVNTRSDMTPKKIAIKSSRRFTIIPPS